MESAPEEDESAAPPPPPSLPTTRNSARGRNSKSKKRKAPGGSWKKPVLIGGITLATVGFLVGGGLLVATLIGDMFRNKIDLTYLPPDSDLVIHARVDETLGSPLAQSILAIPALKQAVDKA